MKKFSDSELVASTLQGDVDAFSELVNRYAPLAFGTARSHLADQSLASDMVQEAFTIAYERLNFLRNHERFGSWLRKLVVTQCALEARQQQQSSRNKTQLAILEGKTDFRWSGENDGELAQAAVHLLNKLPAAQKEAATLCLIREVPRKVAAEFLGIKETTLRKRLHDARRRLQSQVFELAKKAYLEDQLPAGFAKRCVCRCERSKSSNKGEKDTMEKTKTQKPEKKEEGCTCGCMLEAQNKEKDQKKANRDKKTRQDPTPEQSSN